jgi:peptidoglycan hydrolase-like protein with peptidoglycan-binding domain
LLRSNHNYGHFRFSASHSIAFAASLIVAFVSAVYVLFPPGSASAPKNLNPARPNTQITLNAEETREAEQRLSDLGYWTGPVDGALDEGSRQAVIAFQKVEYRRPTGKLTLEDLQAVRTAKRPLAHESGYAHIEVDLTRQVLFAVDVSGTVSKVSSGTGKLFTSEGKTR